MFSRLAVRANRVPRIVHIRHSSELPKFLPNLSDFPDYKVPKDYVMPQKRDPYQVYDDQQNRRNFDTPVHPFEDNLDMWSPDFINPVSDSTAIANFLGWFAGLGSFATAIWFFDLWPERPATPRSYPHGGLYKDLGGKEGEEELYRARIDRVE
ncbi:hypothetical protein KL939_002831 [Ogataea angusta]|nr:hypothetical protein KL939_002831 [Ogataea angusta]